MVTAALSPFGVEIEGAALGALSRVLLSELGAVIARARVAVFRNQSTDDTKLVALLRGLGELAFTEGETPVPGEPRLNIVSNVGRSTPPRSVFHSDTSYVERPPSFTALRPIVLPEYGGATIFSDQVAVAAQLPPKVRLWLAGRSLLHRSSGVEDRGESTRHPLFRRHPLTGETALYLSTPERCVALSGLDDRTSARVVAALYRRSMKPKMLYRHEWRPGDILIWDNRLTMHKADHENVSGDRVLHRGMVRGEPPVAA